MNGTETVGDTDIQILEQLFEGFGEPCSYGECDNPATWMLLCPYDRSAETVCDQHRQYILNMDQDEQIRFDGSCGHSPDVGSCLWEPYS